MISTVREVCKFVAANLRANPTCVETGIIYVCNSGDEEHTTTNNLLEFVCAPSGTLYSLDIDEEHIEFARSFCFPRTANLTCLLGDSVESLKEIAEHQVTVDLLCLDSKDFDEDHMVNEYNAIVDNLADSHYILVDDIHNPNSVKYKKMVPELKKLGYNTVEIPTPTGMLIASKGLPLPNS